MINVCEIKKKIEEVDLSNIKFKLKNLEDGEGWSQDQVDKVEILYRRFLLMLAVDTRVVPTKEIDKMWHYHILDTRAYANDCNKIFGRFMHHFPYLGLRGDDDKLLLNSEFLRTQSLYQDIFGEPYVANNAEFAKCKYCSAGRCSTAGCIGSCSSHG